jgi:hypothetical protein
MDGTATRRAQCRLGTSLLMTRLTSLAKLRVPVGGQEIELQQVEFEAAGTPSTAGPAAGAPPDQQGAAPASIPMNLLRTRIREKSRFTVFDIDPLTAEQWGEALLAWARAQPRGGARRR